MPRLLGIIEACSQPLPAGLTMHWNSGAVEGHVNRIKMRKRQMFGRAKPDLLRKRILFERLSNRTIDIAKYGPEPAVARH
ncbi:hypothetical protein [Nocardia sp. NPDC050718]|uniref:hypothetical protein n=1 Tax=Nocardia sp. NPDC050718 TaxID=3155788 RepID=UPI0034056F99